MKKLQVLLLLLFFPFWLLAQQSVTGKVIDSATGSPISGASVMRGGTNLGTATDESGAFRLSANPGDVIVISALGYTTHSFTVGTGSTGLEVRLSSTANTLDQVIVVGYGTARRSQVVGSISRVEAKEITKQPVLTASQGLQGKAAGVQISATGTPGSQPQVRIRGVGTVLSDANPIYVVDGVITSDITNINNSDILSIEVLKDASAQAIYGSRAGNGVVLVTTRTGRAGAMRIGVDAYTGFRKMTSKVKMADAQTYAAYTNEARAYDGQAPLFALDTLRYNTDWFDAVTHNGLIQNYNVNVSGGTEKTTYYFGSSFFKDQGIVPGNDYTRGAFRINNEYRVASFLKFGHNLNLSVTRSNNKPNVFDAAYRQAPTTPVRFDNGGYGYLTGLSVANPVAQLDYTHDRTNGNRLQGNAYGELTPIKGLVFRSSFNFDYSNANQKIYRPVYFIWSGQQNSVSDLTVSNTRSLYYIVDNNATYSTTLNSLHELKLTAGYSAERQKDDYLMGYVKDVPAAENLWYLGQGDLSTATSNSTGLLIRRSSAYGRLTYTFDRKYNLSASFRRDGSSSFPVDHKWGTFWSVGGSWVITQEEFMKNQTVFDELRLRGGYGKVGLDNLATQRLGILNGITILDKYYGFGGNGFTPLQGITYDQIKDASASWETTKGTDLGLEFSVLNKRLSGDIAYYNKLTNAYVSVSVPSTLGDADGKVFSQAADIRNKGFELTLNWADKIGESFSYHIGGNITKNTNNVDKVRGSLQLKDGSLGNGEIVTYTVEGQPVGSFWVLQTDGLYQSQDEINNSAHISGALPGDFKYVDQNNDGIIDDNDRIFAGSYQPKVYYGINMGLNWKNLDFSVDCYGNAGNKVYNGKKGVRFGNDEIEQSRADNRWSATNPSGTQPRASNSIPRPSTYFVESGSFFRVNNVTLGYTIPTANWHMGFTGFRVFASAQNPIIWKKYSGFTPELPGSATSAGIELSIYPVTTTYMFGVNLNF